MIFAIIVVNFMKGLFYICDTSKLDTLTGFDSSLLVTKWDCLNAGGDWRPYEVTFDNVFEALYAIFHISQSFSWSFIMY